MIAAPSRLRSEHGQASVELVALLPLVLLIGVALMTLLEARAAAMDAAAAAHAGAIALLQREDPDAAARAALGRDARRGTIRTQGRVVTVVVRPATAVPFLDDLFTATATSDAGPEAEQ